MTQDQYDTAVRLAKHTYNRKLRWCNIEEEEIIQAGLARLAEKWREFDPKKAAWSTFAYFQVRGGMLNRVRKRYGRKGQATSLSKVFSGPVYIDTEREKYNAGHGGHMTPMIDRLLSTGGTGDNVESEDTMRIAMKILEGAKLTDNQRRAFIGRMRDKTLSEIADEEEVTPQAIYYRIKGVKKKLKRQARRFLGDEMSVFAAD